MKAVKPPKDARARFFHFIIQREHARVQKEATGKRGVCADALIQQFRFCNVNREHDRVSVWVREHVRARFMDEDYVFPSWNTAILNLAVCRVFNDPPCLEHLVPFEEHTEWPEVASRIVAMSRAGKRMLRGAYLIVSHGDAGRGIPAAEYYAGALTDVWMTDFTQCESMQQISDMLCGIMGFSDFLANQILTDFRYLPHAHFLPDKDTFVLCGPGTRRGINRWHGHRVDASVPRDRGTEFILHLRDQINQGLFPVPDSIVAHFQDPNNLSNCFCEWDKYERALETIALGEKPHLKRA